MKASNASSCFLSVRSGITRRKRRVFYPILSEAIPIRFLIDNQDFNFGERFSNPLPLRLYCRRRGRALAEQAYFENPQISVAEAVINFCKKINDEKLQWLRDGLEGF